MHPAANLNRALLLTFCWFFAALSLMALLSQPGATHDEWFHARSIWCGHGERDPYCREIVDNGQDVPYAVTNIDANNCAGDPEYPLLCPTVRTDETVMWTNTGLYPPLFYFVLSWVVVPSVEVSIVMARLTSALIVSAVLTAIALLLPLRYRFVLFLLIVTTFTASGYFLFSSINPSSWTVFGVGVGWLALHSAITTPQIASARRGALVGFGLLAWVMAAASRWDGPGFVAFSATLAAVHIGWTRFPNRRRQLLVIPPFLVGSLFVVLERFTPISPWYHLTTLFRYSEGQPDNVAFFTYNFLQGLPNALRAIGTLPTLTPVFLPEAVYTVSIALLGYLMLRSFNRHQRLQMLGFALSAIVISLVIMAQVATNDARDTGGIEPRYVYPVLVFAVGWWFLLGPEDLVSRMSRYLKPASIVATALFALTVFTVAERYVDRQTYGVRFLPERFDQWWWTWLPVGPNVVVVLAPLCLALFFRGFIRHGLTDPMSPETSIRSR